jgi:hypothetical protein
VGGVGVAAVASGGSAPASRDGFVMCTRVSDTLDRRDCVEHVVRGDMLRSSTPKAIAHLERAASRDPVVAQDCHMALHPIGADEGARLAREGEPLPLTRPRSFCHEGYVHGMQVAWLDETATPELVRSGARACDSSDVNTDWACGHSLGHVLARRAGDEGGMPRVMRWCDQTYRGAVHLGLDRDSFLTTCAKGALMEFSLRDERARLTDESRHACDGVDQSLLPWCEGNVWLRARVGTGHTATPADELTTCTTLARSSSGRRACVGIVARTLDDDRRCSTLPRDVVASCRRATSLGPVNPASVPAS